MKKKTNTFKLSIILTLLLAFFATQNSWAATKTWIGGTADWNTGANWSPAVVPTTDDDAIIPTGFTITTSGVVNAKTISISGTSTLTITQITNIATAAIGGITLNNTSSLIVNAAVAVTIGNATYRGDIVMNDNSTLAFTTAAATVSLSGTWTKGVDATITNTVPPTISFVGATALSIPSTFNNAVALTVDKVGSTVTLNGAMTTTGALGVTNGTLVVGDYNLTVGGATTIAAGATLNANSSATVSRTFNVAGLTVTGTLLSSGANITNNINAAISMPSTGVLTIDYSTATFAVTTASAGAGGTINALGAKVTFTGIVTWTNLTLNTNSNTDLTFNAAQTGGVATNLPALTVKNITFTTAAIRTLSGDLTVYGNFLNVALGSVILNGKTLTVYGDFNNPATGIVNATATSTLNIIGPVTGWGNQAEFVTDATTTVTITGNGALATITNAGVKNLGIFTLNRPSSTLTVAGAFAVTFQSLTLTSGTLVLPDAAHVVTTTTTIAANGILDLSAITTAASTFTFTTGLSGSGSIIANGGNGAAEPTLIVAATCNYDYAGAISTNEFTDLQILSTQATDITLPSSITLLNELVVSRGAVARKVILSNNLTLTPAIAATEFVLGRLVLNGNTLTFTTTFTSAVAANFILDATLNSTVVFGGAPTFIANAFISDETTNLQFAAVSIIEATILKCKNLTIVGAVAVTTPATFAVYGNIDIQAGGTLALMTNATVLSVYGDVSVAATPGIINATGATMNLYGQLQGEGTYTTSVLTNIAIKGTSSQFVFPATFGATAIQTLTLDRPSGAKLNRNIVIGGAAVTDLIITNGDLDLNGYTITLALVTDVITETAGNTIINTGASDATHGYIATTAGSTAAQAIASGIGVAALTLGVDATQVLRFPVTVPVPGVGLSTSRVYQILTNNVTLASFIFDNTELNSPATDLKLYTAASTDMAFAVKTDQTLTDGSNRLLTENSPVAGKGTVAYSSMRVTPVAAGSFYALAAEPGNGGVMYTYAGADNGYWGTSTNWTPNGVPSKIDQVVIGPNTVVLNGEGLIFECKTLQLNHANATLKPYDNTLTGDNVSLLVNGNITIVAGAEILGVNGKGRINLIIGDGVTAGVSSTISGNADYVPTAGIWLNNLTVNMADVTFPANFVRISGDVSLLSNCAVSGVNAEFWGGANALQTITIPNSSDFVFAKARFDNNAKVTTPSNFTLTDNFLVKSGSQFTSTNGTALFTNSVNAVGYPWNVENGGTLKFWNVEFNDNAGGFTFSPVGTAYIQGNFYQYGTEAFQPTSGTVIFQNTGQKEIVNTQTTTDLVFYNLQVAAGSKVVTSNSLNVAKEIDVKVNASLIAENGTIQMIGTSPLYIKNASTHTLEFNNLTITNTTYTSDSWTIKGDLLTTQALIADKGTITFENVQLKTINGVTAPTFFKLLVADGSKLTTLTTHNFTIANNATNPTGAGIEVAGSGEFYVGDALSVITFDAGVGMASGNPKMITKSSAGRLDFGLITIAASPNNEIATASDLKLTGTGAGVFNNAGAGGKFTATAGTVTFTGAAPTIVSVSPGVSQFYSIKTDGTTALTFPATAQEIYVAGDVTVNGTSSIAPAGVDNKIIFNGGTLQTIGGNSAALLPISFADVVINKANNSELLLGINATIGAAAGHELTLTNGILNLGSKTLTSGASIISRSNGAINGGTGTYIISTNHVSPKLEDVYFTIGGVPTLYNLTVNLLHVTANDLTVNGTLNLNTGNLQIGAGASVSSPIKLIVNGNVTRTAGIFAGSPILSRLVLQGTGTVDNGLSNAYFGGATTVQLEIARGEVLGGNLNIANTSYLRMNTGINNFDLGTNTLTFDATSFLTMISGGIKAGTGSTVDLKSSITTVPASMFRNNECYNLTTAADLTLAGDLTINGTLSGVFQITTNENTLTFGPSATLPVYTDADHIKGNVRRTVTSTATVYPIGNGTALMPVTLKFANGGSEQLVTSSIKEINPVYGRGGNANNAVELEWNFLTEGTAPMDSVNAIFTWVSGYDGGTTPLPNTSFPAKWMQTYWADYRTKINTFTAPSPRVITMASYPLQSSSDLTGTWAIFTATANTDVAKDAAIANTKNKVVIKSINPTPVLANNAFKITVELQDPFGRALTLTTPFEFKITQSQGSGGYTTLTGVIPANQSSLTISGQVMGTASINNQLLIDTSAASANWNPGLSNTFSVLPVLPASQSSAIVFSNVDATSMTIGWTSALAIKAIVVVKADTLLSESEYPVGGTSYFANTIMGAGSSMGSASVVYNGAITADNANTVSVTGLSSNTTYYVYVFSYDGVNGGERYRTTAASGNPKSTITTGSYDDDLTLGTNNTRETSKTIGTNTPVSGTIKTADDVDWFNFTVTSASPNIRGTLVLTSDMGNYDLELYNMDGRRIRRGIRVSNNTEAQVINDLPAGTYTVKVMAIGGSYSATSPYKLKVTTSNNEIFSVTP